MDMNAALQLRSADFETGAHHAGSVGPLRNMIRVADLDELIDDLDSAIKEREIRDELRNVVRVAHLDELIAEVDSAIIKQQQRDHFRSVVRVAHLDELVEELDSAIKQRERDEFRSTIAAMRKTVDIPSGSDFYPLLVAAFGKKDAQYGGTSSWICRKSFEAATGLKLIPDREY